MPTSATAKPAQVVAAIAPKPIAPAAATKTAPNTITLAEQVHIGCLLKCWSPKTQCWWLGRVLGGPNDENEHDVKFIGTTKHLHKRLDLTSKEWKCSLIKPAFIDAAAAAFAHEKPAVAKKAADKVLADDASTSEDASTPVASSEDEKKSIELHQSSVAAVKTNDSGKRSAASIFKNNPRLARKKLPSTYQSGKGKHILEDTSSSDSNSDGSITPVAHPRGKTMDTVSKLQRGADKLHSNLDEDAETLGTFAMTSTDMEVPPACQSIVDTLVKQYGQLVVMYACTKSGEQSMVGPNFAAVPAAYTDSKPVAKATDASPVSSVIYSTGHPHGVGLDYTKADVVTLIENEEKTAVEESDVLCESHRFYSEVKKYTVLYFSI